MLESIWIEPLVNIEDPVRDILKLLEELGSRIPDAMLKHGCPLNNLTQEMSTLDEGFRDRIDRIFARWIEAFAAFFEHAKQGGYIRNDVDSNAVSRF